MNYYIEIPEHPDFDETMFDCETELLVGDFVSLPTHLNLLSTFKITKRTLLGKEFIFTAEIVTEV